MKENKQNHLKFRDLSPLRCYEDCVGFEGCAVNQYPTPCVREITCKFYSVPAT